MTWEKYVRDRDKLVGEWEQTTLAEKVVGVEYQKAEAHAFSEAALKAEKQGTPFGIRLEFEPENPRNPNSIMVFGYAETQGWIGKAKQAEWHIGYLGAELAAELQKDVISSGLPISAELLGIFEDGENLEFSLIVMAPKGFGLEAKNQAFRTRGGTAEAIEKKVSTLISDKKFDAAINLLLDCCDEEEAESRSAKKDVAPWCYEKLAMLFRKMKLRDEEIAILERYQKHLKAPAINSRKLSLRLKNLLRS